MLFYCLLFCIISTTHGTIWSTFPSKRLHSMTLLDDKIQAQYLRDCERDYCSKGEDCFFSINYKENKCYRVMIPAQIVRWVPGLLIADGDWDTVFKGDRDVDHERDIPFIYRTKPVFVWLVDNRHASKSQFFGTLTANHNISNSNLIFPGFGDDRRFVVEDTCIIPTRGSAMVPIPLPPSNINFREQFTIAMWIRTDPKVRYQMLLMGSQHPVSLSFVLGPSVDKNQLSLVYGEPGTPDFKMLQSKKQSEYANVDGWRHVAVVSFYDIIHFYINSEKLSNEDADHFEYRNFIAPTTVTLWEERGQFKKFTGEMACVTMFATALIDEEIDNLKINCP